MYPPHLPPPTCDVSRHRQWERLKSVFSSTFFGLLAGLTGSAIMLGWIWPMIENDLGFTPRNIIPTSREDIQQRAENRISDKLVAVYTKSTAIGEARYFSPSDKIVDGVLSVTSGWLLADIPNFDGKFKGWIGVSQDGSLYSVTKTLHDKKTNLVYLKLGPLTAEGTKEGQFKVATFNTNLKAGDMVFVLENQRWLSTSVSGRVPSRMESHLDSVPPMSYSIIENFKDGSVVVDKDGNVVGFVENKNTIKTLYAVNYFLNGIDEKQNLVYPSMGIEGWYSDEKLLVIEEEKTSGLIVNRVLGNRQFIQKGDIILEVNGREANWDNVWYTILGNKTVRVKIWRAGKIVESEMPIMQF